MTLKRINFSEIKRESQYVVRDEDWEIDLDISDGIDVGYVVLGFFNIGEDEIESYGGWEEALRICEMRMWDGWGGPGIEIYELIP